MLLDLVSIRYIKIHDAEILWKFLYSTMLTVLIMQYKAM